MHEKVMAKRQSMPAHCGGVMRPEGALQLTLAHNINPKYPFQIPAYMHTTKRQLATHVVDP